MVAAALAATALLTLGAAGCGPGEDDDDPPVQLVDAGGGDTGTPDAQTPDGGDTGPTPDTRTADSGAETGRDTGMGGDTADGGKDTGPDGPLDPLPSCQDSTPTAVGGVSEIDTGKWSKATLGSTDAIMGDILQRQFQVPGGFARAYGQLWNTVTPQDDGTVHAPAQKRALVFLAKEFKVDEPTTYLFRAGAAQAIYVNGAKLAADPYGHGDKRIPVRLQAGTNDVVVTGAAYRKMKIEVFETSDAVYFNDLDMTTPQLRVGHKTNQPIGVPIANLAGRVLRDVEAKVVANEHFKATTVEYPSLAANAVTQISWKLEPKKKWATADEEIPVTLRLESCALGKAYEKTVKLKTVAPDAKFRRTFRSEVDGSTQYYAVVPPSNFTPMKKYGVILSLHGAGVNNTAGAYSQKKWAYVIAPTNRRRYGFDWEEWGHLQGMAALDDAKRRFNIDPSRVHVSGHSMGGHGTWHFGVMHPGTFATVVPSAGWASFYTYPPGRASSKPDEPLQSARAHSETKNYLSNLAKRPLFIIHGTADNNVPIGQAKDLIQAVKMAVPDKMDIHKHFEQGADHWWDGDKAEGADCVEWPAAMKLMKNTTLDRHELDFRFKTPGPYYTASHSYATIQSRNSPMKDAKLVSEKTDMETVKLTTTNVRSLSIDGAALDAKGIKKLVLNGVADTTKTVKPMELTVGPADGKQLGQTGPLNQAFQQPFCFVYMNDGPRTYRDLAAHLISTWNIRGNGHACAVPMSLVDNELRKARNLIYLGVPFSKLPDNANLPFNRQSGTYNSGQLSVDGSMSLSIFPAGEGIDLHIDAADGNEIMIRSLFNGYQPFTSRAGMPDFLVFNARGAAQALGYYGPDWSYDDAFTAVRSP